jgi:alanine dehydrogenase
MRRDPHLLEGLNVHEGKVTNMEVAEALGLPHAEASAALE